MNNYFPGYPDLARVKPTKEDIREYLIMRLKKDSEPGAIDTELAADIVRIIPERLSGA